MKDKGENLIEIIILICVPGIALFFMLLMSYGIFIKTEIINNVYGQIICLYGIPIILSLCILPIKLTSSSLKQIGICSNKKKYQDILAGIGVIALIIIFILKNRINNIEGANVLQFIFVGIGEEIFFRAILYQKIKLFFKSEYIAVLIVAAIFGALFHSDGGFAALLLIRIPLSVLFSCIYIKTESLSIPILLHGIYDILI